MNLDALQTDDQRMIADSAKRFAERHGGPARLRTIHNAREGYDTDALRAAADAGWVALLAPESVGGAGLGPGALCLITQALGTELCAIPLAPAAASAMALAESQSASHAHLLSSRPYLFLTSRFLH